MKHFRKYLGQINWASGQAGHLDIPRGNYLRKLILKVAGTFTLASGSASGVVRSEAPATIFNNIDVIGDEFGNLKDFDGTGLYLSTMYHNRTNFPVLTGDGSAATHNILGVFTIDFALPAQMNIRPADTFLDTRRFSSLRVEVDWAANFRDAMYSGNDRTESSPSGWVKVWGEFETPHGNFGEPLIYHQFKRVQQVAAAGANFRFELPVNYTYKNVIMSAQNMASGGQFTGNNALITSYNLIFNADRYNLANIDFVMKQYLDCLENEMDVIHAGANFVPFDLDRMIKESLVTLNGSDLAFDMTVTAPAGTNEIRMYPGVLIKWSRGMRAEVCAPIPSKAIPMQQVSSVRAVT
jgi:hypothetical protein